MSALKKHSRLLAALLGAVALVALVLFWVRGSLSFAAEASITPGTYHVSTLFLSGPQKGQTEKGTLTFNQDHSVVSNYPKLNLTGHGSWWVVDNHVQYSFREVFPGNGGDVQVVHLVTEQNGSTLTSQGRGLIYNASGQLTIFVETVNNLTPA